MSILVFAIVALIVAFLLVAAWRGIPDVGPPLGWFIPVVILILAAGTIAHQAGWL